MASQWFTGGALPPPPGVEPNFENPPSQLHGNIALHASFLSVATIVVAMRLFTRLRILRMKLGIDDFFILLAYCLTITFTGLMSYFSHLTLLFLTIFSCLPVSHAWDAASPGRCWMPGILPYTSGALSSATDLYVLLLPVRTLWALNITAWKRIRLAAVFGLGILAFAASIVRLGMTHVLTSSPDATWNISSISKWATVEAYTGIICACLPVLPALLDRYREKNFGSSLNRLWSGGSRRKYSSGATESEVSIPQRPWQYVKTPTRELQVA
ncbi:hypothetical protein BDV09DRAFT_198742 [Aspergillus tetrazonus]